MSNISHSRNNTLSPNSHTIPNNNNINSPNHSKIIITPSNDSFNKELVINNENNASKSL